MPDSRRWPRRSLIVGVLAGVLLGGNPVAAGADDVPNRVVFAFTDPAIVESSGLIDQGRLMLTANDSGARPVIFAVDRRTGDTVALTRYSSHSVTDVEALAAGRDGAVWVGDIGDNPGQRSTIDVYRVRPLRTPEKRADALDGRGKVFTEKVPAEKFSLVYPRAPHNAEAMLVHPQTERVYAVTKRPTGGIVYAAPETLDPGSANRLDVVGRVLASATDGAFLPDGKHILVRSYRDAVVYTFPELRPVGSIRLPAQDEGETLTIGPGGDIYIGSERSAEVLSIALPLKLSSAMGDASPPPLRGDLALPPPRSDALKEKSDPSDRDVWPGPWVVAVPVLTVAAWVLFTVARRRSRHNP